MKKITSSIVAALAISTFAFAGGDIAPVEPAVEVPEVAPVSEGGFYIGGAVSMFDVSGDYYWYNLNPYEGEEGSSSGDDITFMLQAGYEFNKYLAIEGRYWFESSFTETYTFTNYDINDIGTPGTLSADSEFSAWGIYIKPMYPVTDALSVYGLLGYGNTIVTDNNDYDYVDEDGFQWGAGVSYAFTENLSVFADYVQLCNDTEVYKVYDSGDYSGENYDVYTINFGVTYKF